MKSPGFNFYRSILCFFLVVVFLGFAPCLRAQSPEEISPVQLTAHEKQWLSNHPVVRIAPDPYFPPIELIDNDGRYTGIAADFMQLVQKETGINFKVIRCKDWREVLEKAKSREVDALPAAAQTPERSKYLLYTDPHIVLPGVIITRAKVKKTLTLKDLSEMRVSVVKSYVWQEFLETDFPDIQLDLVPDLQSGLKKVALGISDALVATLPVAIYYIEKQGITNLRVAGETGYYTRLSFASRKDWPELNAIVQKALAQIPQSKKNEIIGKWIQLKGNSIFKSKAFWIILLGLFGACSLIILFIAGWNRSLRRSVNRKTEQLRVQLAERKRIEAELRKSEEKYRLLVMNSNDVIYSIDPGFKLLTVSPQVERLLGYKPEELINRPFQDLNVLAPEYIKQAFSDVTKVLSGEPITASIYGFIAKDGTRKFGEVSGAPLFSGDKVVAVVSVARDITDRVQAEQALKKSEAKYRRIFENIQDIYYETALDGTILEVSPSIEKLSHYKRKELLGKSLYDIYVDPKERDKLVELILEKGMAADYEIHLKDKDGSISPFSITAKLIRNEQGTPVKLVGSMRDISARKQAEKELKESEKKFRSLFDSSPQAIALTDVETGKLVDVNNIFCKLTKYKKEEIIGNTTTHMGFYSEDDRNRFINELKSSGAVNGLEMDFRAKGGNIITTLMFARLVLISGQSFILTIFLDMTEQKRLETRLHQAQKMEAIGALAGGIAHDFNNVLASIIGYTELSLDDLPEDSQAHKDMEEVLNAANRALKMVQQILTFSRQTESEKKPVLVQSVAQEAIKLLKTSIPKTIEIRKNIDADCDPVLADPTQIHQVVMNLATNAYHAMREKGGVLNITVAEEHISTDDPTHPGLLPGRYIRLTVSDTGHGMDKALIEKIFDPYFTTKPVGQGTGMGLSVVLGIVRSHHGDIRVHSEPGKGTVFYVCFPVIKSKPVEQPPLPVGPVPTGTEHILFVDDEAPIVSMAKLMLERLGYTVTTRTSSVEALEAFRAGPDRFDLVITDMTMPNMTGAELAPKLLEVRRDIPIILCTGFSEIMDEDRARALGIREFVMKPVVREQIAVTIRRVLDACP